MPLPSSAASLTLIIADSSELAGAEDFAVRAPTLARLAGRGAVQEALLAPSQRAWLGPQLSILESCELSSDAGRFSSGAVSAIGVAHTNDGACWAHADAVHFAAGLNDLAGLQLRGATQVTAEEHEALSDVLRVHLGADCELHAHRPGGWLLKFPRMLAAQTTAPQHAFSGPLQQALPSGADGGALRRLMTELQMVLHEHAVNHARARRGLPAVNALWIWGLGTVAPQVLSRGVWPKAYGSSAFLKGLYLLHEQTVEALPFTLSSILEQRVPDERVLAVIDTSAPEALQAQWLEPLEGALLAGRIRKAVIHFDRWRILIKRSDLLRFWRAPWSANERNA